MYELCKCKTCTPSGTRTADLVIHSLVKYILDHYTTNQTLYS